MGYVPKPISTAKYVKQTTPFLLHKIELYLLTPQILWHVSSVQKGHI